MRLKSDEKDETMGLLTGNKVKTAALSQVLDGSFERTEEGVTKTEIKAGPCIDIGVLRAEMGSNRDSFLRITEGGRSVDLDLDELRERMT